MDADVEAPPRDVELSALEAEKQPMASPEGGGAGPEKNGLVKAAGPGETAGPHGRMKQYDVGTLHTSPMGAAVF